MNLSNRLKVWTAGAAVFFVLGSVAEAKDCKKGKPCGNTCISQKDVCHKDTAAAAGTPAATPAARAGASEAAATPEPAAAAKNCKTGKPCGKTCIPKDAVCHSN